MKDFLKWMTANALIALLFMLMLSACQKNESTQGFNDNLGGDNSRAEFVSDDAENLGNAAALGQSGMRVEENFLGDCATVTNDTVNHIITIDFGTVNCTGNDGRTRRGKIIINYTGHYFETGSVKIFSFENFYVNDNHVEGTRTVTNEGLNGAGHFHWAINSAITLTKTDGTILNWNRNGEREMLAGQGTETIWDDSYSITGTATGTRNGNAFTAEITSPLIRAMSCHFIKSGTIQITPSTHSALTIDFGNGICDDEATVTCNGNSHSIVLH